MKATRNDNCEGTGPSPGPGFNHGFTVVELMVVLAILSILVTISLPGFRDTVERVRINSQAKNLLSSFSYARSEAIKRGADVTVCGSNSGTDCDAASWGDGWIVYVDHSGTVGTVDGTDEVLRVYDALAAGTALTATTDSLQYNGMGFGVNTGSETFTLCPASGDAALAQEIRVHGSGRGRRIKDNVSC